MRILFTPFNCCEFNLGNRLDGQRVKLYEIGRVACAAPPLDSFTPQFFFNFLPGGQVNAV